VDRLQGEVAFTQAVVGEHDIAGPVEPNPRAVLGRVVLAEGEKGAINQGPGPVELPAVVAPGGNHDSEPAVVGPVLAGPRFESGDQYGHRSFLLEGFCSRGP